MTDQVGDSGGLLDVMLRAIEGNGALGALVLMVWAFMTGRLENGPSKTERDEQMKLLRDIREGLKRSGDREDRLWELIDNQDRNDPT